MSGKVLLIALLASSHPWQDICVPAQLAIDAYHASGRTAQAVAETLLEQAQKRRSKDDISVIAIVFGTSPSSQAPPIAPL